MEIKISGTVIPTPKTCSVIISDTDGESGRNANGDMVRDRIATKRKVSLEWPPLTQAEVSQILSLVSPEFVNVEYLDPQLGVVTKNMYVGDREGSVLVLDLATGRWSGLKFNLIER